MNLTAVIREAREVSRQRGYTQQTWLLALNRGPKTEPELREAAAILAGLAEGSPPNSASKPKRRIDA